MSRGGRYVRKRSLTGKQVFLILLNVVLLAAAIASAMGLRSVTHALRTQSADQVWRGSNEMRFAQVSAFLPARDGIEAGQVEQFRRDLDQTLIDASLEAPEGASLWVDAWSGSSQLSVSSDKASAEVTALGVGGEWFLFHPLTLRSGNYLSGGDYMQDGVVLDEELAWALFGGTDVAGMDVYIRDRPYPVVGVVHREDDFATQKAYTAGAGLFISYDALAAMDESLRIDCYELVMPDMITGFALKTLNEKFPLGGGVTVENSSRYDFLSLVKILGDFGTRSMNTHGVAYPYWENAARMTEDYAAALLLLTVVFALCPVITGTVLLVRAVKAAATTVGTRVPAFVEQKVEAKKEKNYVRRGI